MSAIDVYKHKILGSIECPSTHHLVYSSDTKYILIYQLLQNVPDDEDSFDGKQGDILVGGGRGEAPALRLSNPLAFQWCTVDTDTFCDLFGDKETHEVFKAFWTPTQSFIIGEGFAKVGWTVDTGLEQWLAENVCKILMSAFSDFRIHNKFDTDLSSSLTLIL